MQIRKWIAALMLVPIAFLSACGEQYEDDEDRYEREYDDDDRYEEDDD